MIRKPNLEKAWKKTLIRWGEPNGLTKVRACGLCDYTMDMFTRTKRTYEEGSECHFCPIARFTGVDDCRATPYWDWRKAIKDYPEEAAYQHEMLYTFLLFIKEATKDWPELTGDEDAGDIVTINYGGKY
jgi:hypothetical protein